MKKLTVFLILFALIIFGVNTTLIFSSNKEEVRVVKDEWAEVTKNLPTRYEGTTLNILTESAWGDIFLSLSKEFEEATGIKLQMSGFSYMDHYEKAMLDSLSGSPTYDIHYNAYQWYGTIGSSMADLEKLSKEVPDAPPLKLDDYPKRALDIHAYYQGRLIGLPAVGDVTFILWNKDHFRKIGLNPEKAPSSWEEINKIGKELTMPPDRYGFGMPAGKSGQTAVMFYLLFNAFGGQYFDKDLKPLFDSEAGIKAMKFIAENLKEISPPDCITWDFPEMVTTFATQQSSMIFMWNGGLGIISDPEKSQVVGKYGFTSTPKVSMLGGWVVSVADNSKNKEAAYLYASWASSPEIVKIFATKVGSPVRSSALRDPELIKQYPFFPATLKALESAVSWPPIKETETLFTYIANQVNAAVSGEKSPEQAVRDLQKTILEMMTEHGYYD